MNYTLLSAVVAGLAATAFAARSHETESLESPWEALSQEEQNKMIDKLRGSKQKCALFSAHHNADKSEKPAQEAKRRDWSAAGILPGNLPQGFSHHFSIYFPYHMANGTAQDTESCKKLSEAACSTGYERKVRPNHEKDLCYACAWTGPSFKSMNPVSHCAMNEGSPGVPRYATAYACECDKPGHDADELEKRVKYLEASRLEERVSWLEERERLQSLEDRMKHLEADQSERLQKVEDRVKDLEANMSQRLQKFEDTRKNLEANQSERLRILEDRITDLEADKIQKPVKYKTE